MNGRPYVVDLIDYLLFKAGYEPRGSGFNSCQPHHNKIVIEQQLRDQKSLGCFSLCVALLHRSYFWSPFSHRLPLAVMERHWTILDLSYPNAVVARLRVSWQRACRSHRHAARLRPHWPVLCAAPWVPKASLAARAALHTAAWLTGRPKSCSIKAAVRCSGTA